MEIHQLGAIDMAYDPGSGVVSESANSAYTPGGDIATNLNQVKSGPKNLLGRPKSVLRNISRDATQSTTIPPTGGGAAPDVLSDKGVEVPSEAPKSMNKKNLLLFGIGGLVLAYLLFRKK